VGDASQLTTEERTALRRQIEMLSLEHRDLDDVIHRMTENVYVDQLQLKRLKKRKLLVKDRIERLKSRLLPDILA
jgi:hypothetical protein